MEDVAGWSRSTPEPERRLAFWLFGDVFVLGQPPWIYGAMVELCDLRAQAPALVNLRARAADCP